MKWLSIVFAAGLAFAASSAAAHDYKIGAIEIMHPWARATPKGAKVGAGYLTIVNKGSTPDRLVGGTMEFAGRFEIHEMAMDGSVMRMRMLANGIEIKPGATVELKPGSFHLMFVGLTRPLAKGERLKATLVFEQAGTVALEFAVEAIAESGGHSGH